MRIARLPPHFDPNDPIAPSEDEWAALTPEERSLVRAALPFVVENDFMSEGDLHAKVVFDVAEMLDCYWTSGGGGGRRFYIGRSLMVHYPGQRGFAPDLMVVFDVPNHPRNSWLVTEEGRGLDLALEVLNQGNRAKDLVRNVNAYASLGIPEYFAFDVTKRRIHGFRLPPGGGPYVPIVPQHGRYHSDVLGLSFGVEGASLRLFSGSAPLPLEWELRRQLAAALKEEAEFAQEQADFALAESERADAEAAKAALQAERAQTEAERARAEAERARAEGERADRAERELAELRTELEALRRQRPS